MDEDALVDADSNELKQKDTASYKINPIHVIKINKKCLFLAVGHLCSQIPFKSNARVDTVIMID